MTAEDRSGPTDRVVVDTNVLVSGLYWTGSPPGRILQAATEDRLSLFAPAAVLWELERTIVAKLGRSPDEVEEVVASLPVEWLEAPLFEDALEEAARAIGDPADVPVVACAVALGLDVVSGDSDFHPLVEPIVTAWTPRAFVDEVLAGDG